MGGMGGPDWGAAYRAEDLVMLIQYTIAPDSWYETGIGEGTITPYPTEQPKKLAVLQTREVHREIEDFLSQMRKALGHQVSIEARFLAVSENFLEDIGLDVDFTYKPGGKWSSLFFDQESFEATVPSGTKVPGTLADTASGINIEGGWGTTLDDLRVHFLLRAVQAHKDAKTLTAPNVTVLNGESASFVVQTSTVIALPPEVGSQFVTSGVSGIGTAQSIVPVLQMIPSGTTLNITPIISKDKKHVLLEITTNLNDFLGMKSYNLETPLTGGQVAKYKQELPETEWSQVQTRVSVPDGGTLLLGGQKVTSEVEMEAGVPVLSKVPILGRLFSNRSTVKDHKILLILVKPTIILQEERDAEAIGAMESNF